MHSGLAVIVSDLPSLSELVDSETGYIVPLDDSANLIQTFREIASDFEMPYQKGKKAAKKIAAICSYERMVNAYRELYLSAK
jgi:glycosyltransferase involved in cell wall biosynthesis